MTRAVRTLVPLAIVTAGTAALWLRFNAPPGQVGAEFPFDLVFYYLPMMEQAAEQLRAGEIPLWNRHNGCGMPLLATAQVGVLYPGNWPAAFLPVERVVPARMFAECILGGLFTAGFLRSLGVRPPACGAGGVLFVFACMIGQTLWPPQVAAIAWMPLMFWSVERFVPTGRRAWAGALIAALSMQILAGYPQYVLYTLYLLVPYTVMRLMQVTRGGRQGDLPTPSCSPSPAGGGAGRYRASHDSASPSFPAPHASPGALGALTVQPTAPDGPGTPPPLPKPPSALGVSAILLLSGLAAVLLTAAQWLPTLELARQTVRQEPLRAEEVHYLETERGVLPSLTRMLANAVNPAPKFTALDHPDGAGYLGLPAAPLILVAVVAGRRRPQVWFMLAAALVFLLLSLGHYGPLPWLYRLYASMPTGGMFRTPGRLRLPAFFCLVTLVAVGLDRVCARTGGPTRLHRSAWAVDIVLAAVLLADVVHATGRYGSLRDIPSAWTRCFHVDGCRVLDDSQFNALVARAGNDRIAMVGMLPLKPTRPLDRGLFIGDYEPLMPRRQVRLSAALGGRPGRTMLDIDPDRHPLIYDLAAVRYLYTAVASEAFHLGRRTWADCYAGLAPRPTPPGLAVRETINQDALPRAYVVFRHEVCNPEQALERVVRGNLDARNVVLLEQHPPAPPQSGAEPIPLGEPVEVELVEDRPRQVAIDVRMSRDGLLVLTDSWYPGWEAEADGRPLSILRANYLFRAVRLSAGRHRVLFRYRPWSWRAGLLLSGVFGSTLTAGLLFHMRPRAAGGTHSVASGIVPSGVHFGGPEKRAPSRPGPPL